MKAKVLTAIITTLSTLLLCGTSLGAPSSDEDVQFVVFDIERPSVRSGKTLMTTPRNIFLYASRDPTTQERRSPPRRSRRGQRVKQSSSPSWVGKILRIYRLSPVSIGVQYPSPSQLALIEDLRYAREEKTRKKREELERERAQGSPLALEQPTLPTSALEAQEDDDDLDSPEEDQICGHEGEACCETTVRGPCDIGLLCLEERCALPPPPCGDFEQRCCEEEPVCSSQSLECLDSIEPGSTTPLCQFPPPAPAQKKTLVGIVQVTKMQGRVLTAKVLHDGLSISKRRPLHAISLKDLAEFY